MKLSSKSLHSRLIRHLREWHRKLGIVAAFFIIFLSLSGVALNHTTSLSLAQQPIKSSWLLNHYGVATPSDVRFYQNNSLIVTNNLLWLNGALLQESDESFIAATFIPSVEDSATKMVLAVSDSQIYLFDMQGNLIDQLGEELGVPQNINALHVTQNNIIVKTREQYFTTTTDFLAWEEIVLVVEPQWITPEQPSEALLAKAILAYRSQFLTLERIILDAHSGRIFGLIGVLFMDFVALLLVLLSLSGIYIWLRYARAKR